MLATAAGGTLCRREQRAACRWPQRRARRDAQAGDAALAHTAPIVRIQQVATVKPYLVSLCVGLLVGAIYASLRVRSPAPPVIALVGLLGMLAGEQAIGLVRQHFQPDAVAAAAPGSSTNDPGNRHAP